ncbi:MAG TPA: PH domain-containing protein, partial [Dehalococcoidia bacterium]
MGKDAMVYKPPRNPGLLTGALLTLWPLALGGLLLLRGLSTEVSLTAFLYYVGAGALLAVALLFGYWTYACASLRYSLDRNALAIQWGVTRLLVPLDEIQRLIPGGRLSSPTVRGINWPGHHVGRARVERLGEVLFYSTHRTRDQILYVQTAGRTYGITILDPAGFAAAVQELIQQGPEQRLR